MRDQLTLHCADGTVISAWQSFILKDDYTDPLGSMEFVAAPPRERITEYASRLAKGEKVTVKINNVPQATVLIESAHIRIGPTSGTVFTLRCKSLLAPMFAGSVSPPDYSFRSKSDTPISNVVLAIAKPYGFDTLNVDERANRDTITGRSISGQGEKLPLDALKYHETQAHEGETAYAMIARLVTRLGVCLRCTWDGKLMLSRPNYDQAPSYTVVQAFRPGVAGDYFIGDIEIEDTNEGQYSAASVRGQAPDKHHSARAARPTATVTADQLGNGDFHTYRSTAAPFRPKLILDKNARDRERCQSVAKLALGLPARKAFTIVGDVAGFSATTGAIWNVDTVVTVQIDALKIKSAMWIIEREFRQDRKGGQTTRLTIIPKGFLLLGEVPH